MIAIAAVELRCIAVQKIQIANAVAKSYQARNFDLRIKSSGTLLDFMGKELSDLKDKTTASEEKVAQLGPVISCDGVVHARVPMLQRSGGAAVP